MTFEIFVILFPETFWDGQSSNRFEEIHGGASRRNVITGRFQLLAIEASLGTGLVLSTSGVSAAVEAPITINHVLTKTASRLYREIGIGFHGEVPSVCP